MFVKESFRKQKVGTKLLKECMAALKTEGIHKAALLVFKYNKVGSRFWEKQGFVVREDVDIGIWN